MIMMIKITEEQLKNLINTNEDYGIPDEYELNEPVRVTIHSTNGSLDLGKMRKSLANELSQVASSIRLVNDNHIFVEIN